jgi:Double-GTPase 1
MTTNTSKVLLIGEHDSGKTVYGAQLHGRLREKSGEAYYYSAPENIRIFDEAMKKLNKGLLPSHTPGGTQSSTILPITDGIHRAEVTWPDYYGELLTEILTTRQISEPWKSQVSQSDSWVLIIRPDRIREQSDVFNKPLTGISHNEATDGFEWNDQSRYIELLQIFLHLRGLSLDHRRVQQPSITVLLSCWDEQTLKKTIKKPVDLLNSKMPLFATFLQNMWDKDCADYFGLSSLGMALDRNTPNSEFADAGPENQGYLILPDGERSSDLTLPLRRQFSYK